MNVTLGIHAARNNAQLCHGLTPAEMLQLLLVGTDLKVTLEKVSADHLLLLVPKTTGLCIAALTKNWFCSVHTFSDYSITNQGLRR